jgi:DNA-binding transcriptional regulator/RsmH inhibitor MraZ
MADAGRHNEYFFVNSHPLATDAQWRIHIPRKWRPESGQETFFVQVKTDAVAGKYLRVFPMEEAIRMRNAKNAEIEKNPALESRLREVSGKMDSMELDSAGRITLPESMARQAGIEKGSKVIVVGCFGFFEVWGEANHAKVPVSEND